jgi:hypothetical protein
VWYAGRGSSQTFTAEAVDQVQAAPALGGEEILVLEGVFQDEHGSYPKSSWLRSPHLSAHHPFTGPDGAHIYVKTGHLVRAWADKQPARHTG